MTKNNYLIIGPLPPAIGGIATIISLLQNGFARESGIFFVDTNKSSGFFNKMIRPIKLLMKITFFGLKMRGGTVLMFSSAYGSFWEKCLWCFVCKLCGLNTVVLMVDGNFPDFYEGLPKYLKGFSLKIIKTIDILAVQSHQWMLFYKRIFPHTTLQIVSPGIDTDFFTPPSIERTTKNPVEILYIGWLIKEKGIYDLLDALPLVESHGLSFTLKLIGPDFGDKEKIYDYVKKLNLKNQVVIPGAISSRELLRQTYQSADIFVFPSHFEGFPYALMEAVSSGLPCIGTRVGGIPDILDNGTCGLLIESKSISQLAESLCKLIEDQSYRLTLGKKARERASIEYSLEKSFHDFKSVLNFENNKIS